MIYDTLKAYLQVQPQARERANKNRAIGNIIIDKYHLKIDKSMMADMVGEILNADRAWRKVLEDNKDLRGTDYWEKTDLEIKKRKELGY
jgi:hypothetical protein